jgi:endonuclease/exonuclease/phosphatase (EEP) superfamily protein YafD
VLQFARAADADLVVLVDARQRRWQPVLDALAELYPYRAPRAWRARPPVILLSRHPIISAKVMEAPRSRRPYLVAEVQVGEQTLVIAGVHPSSPSPSEPRDSRRRNRELDHIAEVAGEADRPLIVAGDFNTTPWSPYFHDLLTAAGLRNAADGQGYIGTWPTWFWPALIPIDHVLVRGPLAVTTVRRGPAVGSDHYPIIANLRLVAGPSGPSPPRPPQASAAPRRRPSNRSPAPEPDAIGRRAGRLAVGECFVTHAPAWPLGRARTADSTPRVTRRPHDPDRQRTSRRDRGRA